MTGASLEFGANDPASIGFLKHPRNFEEFTAAIRDGREPSTSARQARTAVALIEAIYLSAREGAK
jgi:predicted dehydrogenase